jgi:hypothetical protein
MWTAIRLLQGKMDMHSERNENDSMSSCSLKVKHESTEKDFWLAGDKALVTQAILSLTIEV